MKPLPGRRTNELPAVPASPARGLRTQVAPVDGLQQDSFPWRYWSEPAPRYGNRPPGPDLPPGDGFEKPFSTPSFMPPAAQLLEPARSPLRDDSRSLLVLPTVFDPWRTIGRTWPVVHSPIHPNRLRASHVFPNDGGPDKGSLAELEELPSISAESAARCHTHEPAREPQF